MTREITVSSLHLIPSGFTGRVKFATPVPDGAEFYWYEDGLFHREDGPAVIRLDGTLEWYKDGKRHREDGPAIERPDGTNEWYYDNLQQRVDGPTIEHSNGVNKWYNHEELVAKNSKMNMDSITLFLEKNEFSAVPKNFTGAIVFQCGNQAWFNKGKLHRVDGPAYIYKNGLKEWWLNGEKYSFQEFAKLTRTSLPRHIDYVFYDDIAQKILDAYQDCSWFIGLELCYFINKKRYFFKVTHFAKPAGVWISPFFGGVEVMEEKY